MPWDNRNRQKAIAKSENPDRVWQRIYNTLDSIHVTSKRPGEFGNNERRFFCPAIIILPDGREAVIDARGRKPGGFEDNTMRVSADRKQQFLTENGIPFLMGRNNWDTSTWEIMIRRFVLALKYEPCPQHIGKTPRYQSPHRKRKRISHGYTQDDT